MKSSTQNKSKKSRGSILDATVETVIFAMLGALMFASKKAMEALPNIHLIGMFIMATTIVYRKKALIPLYVYIMLDGLFGGFSLWWLPYLYIWTILWAITMLLPKNMPKKTAMIVYPTVNGIYGLLFGVLYSPAQALLFGLSFKGMLAWIVSGLPFDALHAVGNIAAGLLVLPLAELLKKVRKLKGNAV